MTTSQLFGGGANLTAFGLAAHTKIPYEMCGPSPALSSPSFASDNFWDQGLVASEERPMTPLVLRSSADSSYNPDIPRSVLLDLDLDELEALTELPFIGQQEALDDVSEGSSQPEVSLESWLLDSFPVHSAVPDGGIMMPPFACPVQAQYVPGRPLGEPLVVRRTTKAPVEKLPDAVYSALSASDPVARCLAPVAVSRAPIAEVRARGLEVAEVRARGLEVAKPPVDSASLTRRQRVERYLLKRSRRSFRKVVRYQCRKICAETRPRIKGRFVKREELGAYGKAAAAEQ